MEESSKNDKNMASWNVLDLFSGAGGMSFGFHSHPSFRIIGAVDAQNGKPSSGKGTLECNSTYGANMGITPLHADIGELSEGQLRQYLLQTSGTDQVDVLISCAPCTGFSRTVRKNLVEDDPRNSLVLRSAEFVKMFQPSVFLMENVGELLRGKFAQYFAGLKSQLEELGYTVTAELHALEKFGLPQSRRRALVVAVKNPLKLRTIHDLWQGYAVRPESTTVRAAIGHLPNVLAGESHPHDPLHVSPNFSPKGMQRLKLVPKDGGSWPDLLKVPGGAELLIPSMMRQIAKGGFGPYTDVYGRLAWDKPAVTLKRECGSTGNGRYGHPEQDRHCTVREMGILQGFPRTYKFVARSASNMYRHIGDAVPPLISFQLAHLTSWILTGEKPSIYDAILPNSHLSKDDIEELQVSNHQMQLTLQD